MTQAYLRARYYDPSVGRFISEDSHWNTHNMIYGDNNSSVPDILAIRQSSNLYSAFLNNPIRYTDPTGLAVWLVHGTFNGTDNHDLWVSSDFWSQATQDYVAGLFNEPLYAEAWSGGNSTAARTAGAEGLRDMVMAYLADNPGEPIRLVGHSHGGNVAIEAANLLAAAGVTVETLITIATPVRGDYQLNAGAVNQHINVYNKLDTVQVNGGNDRVIWGLGEQGTAGRTFDGATNVNIPKTSIPGGSQGPFASHGAMHNSNFIWRNYIKPKI